MTREEAIKIIYCYDIGFYDLSGEKIPADKLAEALDMAIEALHREEAEEKGYCHRINYIQKPCENANCDCVSVVRCKDCRYRKGKVNRKGFEVCDATGMDITDDDFCSYGERREP